MFYLFPARIRSLIVHTVYECTSMMLFFFFFHSISIGDWTFNMLFIYSFFVLSHLHLYLHLHDPRCSLFLLHMFSSYHIVRVCMQLVVYQLYINSRSTNVPGIQVILLQAVLRLLVFSRVHYQVLYLLYTSINRGYGRISTIQQQRLQRSLAATLPSG